MTRPRTTILLTLLLALDCHSPGYSQSRHSDVMVTVMKDKIVALSAGGSGGEESLGVNETVVTTGARGHTGFAQTTNRLLGFSSGLRRWTEILLGVEEKVERHQILPALILVQSDRQVYGYQEGRGHWTSKALGTSETVKQIRGRGHIAVALTTERALAFSSYTGGFFSIPWSTDERAQTIDETGDAVMIRTSTRTLAFRSQTTEWIEVRQAEDRYILPSSNSIASAQVEAGGSDVTATPRFFAISSRRP